MIAQGRYSEAQLLSALRSSSRDVYYEYTLVNLQGDTMATLDITDGKITFDTSAPVMRTFSGTVHNSPDLNLYTVDYRLVPWLCLNLGTDTIKWALGKFLINPSEYNQNGSKTFTLDGYDLGKIADMYYESDRVYVSSGSVCTNNITSLLNELYGVVDVTASASARNYSNEWGIGENRLTIVNQMLDGIGYNPLWFNEVGCAMGTAYVDPNIRPIDISYIADEQSIITDGIARSTDMFDVPNKFVRWVENVDADYVIGTYTNTDVNSPYSTVRRGRTIVDAESVEDVIATASSINDYVKRVANEKTMAAEYITFETLNMPGHNFKDCLFISIPQYNIEGKYIEIAWEMNLSEGGLMTHRCSKVVNI